MPKHYDSREAAAKAALEEAMGLSKRFEHAGVIYEQGGKFYYTTPENSHQKHSVNVKVRYPKGAKLVGLYHTHPDMNDSQFFSQTDIEVARRLGVPYYMGNMRDRLLRTFDPKSSKVEKGKIGNSRIGQSTMFSEGDPLEVPAPPTLASAEPSPIDQRVAQQDRLSVLARRERIQQATKRTL